MGVVSGVDVAFVDGSDAGVDTDVAVDPRRLGEVMSTAAAEATAEAAASAY